MTQLSEEQKERLKQIRERHWLRSKHGTPTYVEAVADIATLLSLLDSDSQAATDDERRAKALAAREDWQRFDWDGAKPYKEHLRERLQTVEDYSGYLNACHEEGPETFALAVHDVLEFAATAMRDKCVEKMKSVAQVHREMAEKFKGEAMGEIQAIRAEECEGLADALSSLTLDQVKPGEV